MRLDRWFRRRWPHLTHVPDPEADAQRPDPRRRRAGEGRDAARGRRPGARAAAARRARRPKRGTRLSSQDRAFVRGLVLYEDDEVLALNKPAGLAVQGGTKTSRHIDRLLSAWGEGLKRPRLVHRLDRDTSGVLVLGKSPAAAAKLAGAFARRRTQKTYWAIVAGTPKPGEGVIDIPLAKTGLRRPRDGGAGGSEGPEGRAGRDRVRHHLPRRPDRRLAGAAALHRPHPPAARPHAGDRPSDPGRSEVPHRSFRRRCRAS